MSHKITFIGAGNMAEAMVKGLMATRAVAPGEVTVTDVSDARLGHMSSAYGVHTDTDNARAVKSADVIVLSVKPQTMDGVLAGISKSVTNRQLIISIAAGVTVERIQKGLGKKARIIRTMPNTPALIGEGAAAMFAGEGCKSEDATTAKGLLGAVCPIIVEVHEEGLMDAVTGLSGSGPAYVFVFLEAMSDAGVRMGLPRDTAAKLAAQTVLGAASLAVESGRPLSELKDMVTSPGGTTINGLERLEAGGMRAAVHAAVEAATKRSKELGS
jgi:pyrroline-5-carboxylate reductase